MAYSVADNMVLCNYYRRPFARGLQRRDEPIMEQATRLIEEFDVRTPSPNTPARNLSGGNQQKVIVARELSRPVRLVIASQPTRGLDVGSIEFIHGRIIEQRDEGIGVLLVSAELDEILALSDRIAVMYHGQIVATLPASEATREELGLLMAGGEKRVPGESFIEPASQSPLALESDV
jgi:simple sugar transport system ATP-binding protein